MPRADVRHKHVEINQTKLEIVKRHFGVKTDREAIDRALTAFADEAVIVEALDRAATAGMKIQDFEEMEGTEVRKRTRT